MWIFKAKLFYNLGISIRLSVADRTDFNLGILELSNQYQTQHEDSWNSLVQCKKRRYPITLTKKHIC